KVHHEIHGAHESIGGTPTGATGTVRAPPLFAFFVFLCGNSISAFGFSDSFDRRFPVGETPTGAAGTVALPVSIAVQSRMDGKDATATNLNHRKGTQRA